MSEAMLAVRHDLRPFPYYAETKVENASPAFAQDLQ
jgi:hypothetical protein